MRVLTVPAGMPEQPAGLLGGQVVEDRGLHDRPQLGRQAVSAPARSPCSTPREHLLLGRRLGSPAAPGSGSRARMPAQRVDQPPDRDAPDPGADLARPSQRRGAAPDGDERVLHGVVDAVRIVAAPLQAQREPRRVPVVEDAQGARSPARHRGEEIAVVGRGVRHAYPVAVARRNGSPSGR